MIALPLQLFVVRSKQPYANKDLTVASFMGKHVVVDPVFVDTVSEINDRRSNIGWYGVLSDSEYIEGKLVKQVYDFMKKPTVDFLICFKPLPLENRISFQPRFVRSRIKLRSNWDVEDRRPIPYQFARCYRGFIVDHNARADDASKFLS
jgi:hypothetical protein